MYPAFTTYDEATAQNVATLDACMMLCDYYVDNIGVSRISPSSDNLLLISSFSRVKVLLIFLVDHSPERIVTSPTALTLWRSGPLLVPLALALLQKYDTPPKLRKQNLYYDMSSINSKGTSRRKSAA